MIDYNYGHDLAQGNGHLGSINILCCWVYFHIKSGIFSTYIMEQQASSPTPIPGSLLLKAALSNRNRIPKSASSGSSNVDNLALQGGFRYGEITSIAGAHGTGKTTVC